MSDKNPRVQISKRVRFEVFKRDGFQCQYCGASPPEVLLHVDHIEPVSKGGGNDHGNLVTACQGCNLGKSNIPLSSVPKPLEDIAAETAERESQLAAYAEIMRNARERLEDEVWQVAEELSPNCGEDGYRKDRLSSIGRFVTALSFPTVLDAASIARARFPFNENRAFKYFCGICWRLVREGEEQ